ncbi:MAG: class II fructose-bisphosphate aldolase [Luteolibacter sp.]
MNYFSQPIDQFHPWQATSTGRGTILHENGFRLEIGPQTAYQEPVMPVATPAQYRAMLDAAQKGGYAYPAINVTSIVTINAALRAFSESKSDGIIQVSTGGGQFASGTKVNDAAFGAIVLAEATHLLAEKYDILVALHTDHCHPEKVDGFLKPLLEASRKRIAEGKGPLFQSHMFDGSVVDLKENLRISKELLKECAELGIILEVEAGCVGGEEDGHDTSGLPIEKLYTTPEDMVEVYEALQPIGRFLFAATFGNVHGSYKPGAVKLKPSILKDGQAAVIAKHGPEAEMDLVFHGGSGTSESDLRETLDYGVVKMNIDTDTQYAFTRPIVSHMCKNIEGVLKIDGEVGDKKAYDPRSYLKKAEISVADRLIEAANDLLSSGKTIFGTV